VHSIGSKLKRYPVPEAPHQTTFFRSQSKRPLKKGERLRESDNNLEIGWLIQKHSGILEEILSLSISEKNLLKTYDASMLSEHLASGCYLPDAILRFIKSNKSWLQDHDTSSELFKLVTKLMVDGAVPDDFIKPCRQTLQGGIEKGKSQTYDPMKIDKNVEGTDLKRGNDTCTKCCQIIATRRHSMICSNRVRPSIHAPLNAIF
jgi:VEFS-Box of polycomb protein